MAMGLARPLPALPGASDGCRSKEWTEAGGRTARPAAARDGSRTEPAAV